MSRLREMGTLIERCSRRADKEIGTNDHIGSAEWRALISEAWGAEVFESVAETGYRYFETSSDLTSDGSAFVDEPSNLLSVIRVEFVDTDGRRYELPEINSFEEGMLGQLGSSASSGRAYYFAHVDSRFYLYPPPASGGTYRVQYIPQAPDISGFADDDCVDLVNANGEACLYWAVSVLALVKAKQDASFHQQRADRHKEKLVDWAILKSMSQPRRRMVSLDDLDFSDPCAMDPAEYR